MLKIELILRLLFAKRQIERQRLYGRVATEELLTQTSRSVNVAIFWVLLNAPFEARFYPFSFKLRILTSF